MVVSRLRSLALVLGSAVALAACATGGGIGPTRVTRFHLNQPIAPAAVALEPRPGIERGPEFDTYAAIVGGELTRLGFRPAPNLSGSELVAVIDVVRGTREGLTQRGSGLSVGLGGGSFGGGRGGGVGLGGGVSFPIGKRRSNDVTVTQLAVQLKRRSEGSVIWEGRAQSEARADSNAADPDIVVRRLAAALFQGFPGESGRTIEVK